MRIIEPLLLVPYSFSGREGPFELCMVECIEDSSNKSWGPDYDNQIIRSKLFALQKYFQQNSETVMSGREIGIIPLERESGKVATLSTNTTSVFLGVFFKAANEILNRKFKRLWDFIIVTGDINPYDGIIEPKAVKSIKKKFKGVKDLVSKYPAKKYLFLYVHESGTVPIEPGWHDNDSIEVKAFSSRDSLITILAFVFEPVFDTEQQRLLEKADSNATWEYVSTPAFEDMQKEAGRENWKGYFIYGEGESGKSALALALAKYLMETECIYAPIWVSLRNQALVFANPNPKDKRDPIAPKNKRDPIADHIASGIAPFLKLNWTPGFELELLRQSLNKKRYLLIIDDLELDKADQVLDVVKVIITGCDPQTKPPVIITSRFKWNNAKSFLSLGLITKEAPLLTKKEIDELVYRVAAGNSFEKNLHREDVEYQIFIDKLTRDYASFPGILTQIVPLLENKGTTELMNELSGFNYTLSIYSFIFAQMEPFTQAVLFAFINLISLDKIIDISVLSLKQQILIEILNSGWTNGAALNEWQLEENIPDALEKLCRGNIIHQRDKNYYMKSLTYVAFMFNPDLKGEILSNGKTTRDTLINLKNMIFEGLRFNQSVKIIEDLLVKLIEEEKNISHYPFMHFAAFYSDKPEHIDLLISYGLNINVSWENHRKIIPLHCAALENHNIEVFKRLLKNGADINAVDANGFTILHCAVKNTNKDIIKMIIDKNINLINAKTFDDLTPLHIAVFENGFPDALRILIESGADINAKYSEDSTLLHYAAGNSSLDIIKILIDYKADINAMDSMGRTPLLSAGEGSPDPAVISFLVEKGSNIYDEDIDGANLLHHAAMNPNIEVFKTILDMGFDWQSTDKEGGTMLHYAAMNPNPAILLMLIDKKMDLLARDADGFTIFHSAICNNKNPEIIVFLLNNGFSVHTVDPTKETPLHWAAMYNPWPQIIEILIKSGADVNAKNIYGVTPLHFAAYGELVNPNVVATLVKNGASLKEKHDEGKTPLYYLKKRKDWPLIKTALKEAGIEL